MTTSMRAGIALLVITACWLVVRHFGWSDSAFDWPQPATTVCIIVVTIWGLWRMVRRFQ